MSCSQEMVIFNHRVQKIHGIYYQMEGVMCRACYDAKQYCSRGRVQTGPVVTRTVYRAWINQEKELEKMQKKLEIQQHHDDLKAGKVG